VLFDVLKISSTMLVFESELPEAMLDQASDSKIGKHKKLKFVNYVDWSMLSQNYRKLCWIRLRTPRYGKHQKLKLERTFHACAMIRVVGLQR
jgi:hypothetical protein